MVREVDSESRYVRFGPIWSVSVNRDNDSVAGSLAKSLSHSKRISRFQRNAIA